MLRLRTYALAVAVAVPSLVACGGDDGGNNNTPDAAPDSPMGPTCTAISTSATAAAFVSNPDYADQYLAWELPIETDLGTGGEVFLDFEFLSAGGPLTGSIDLSAGDQANYATCNACATIFALNAAGNAAAKTFFQDGGTLNLTVDPFTGLTLMGTATDVSFVEVTIDQDSLESTPVSGGVCLSLASLNLSGDAVPTEWTCTKDKYNDGATCDCACGAHDPDCDITSAPVAGCTGTQVCGSDDTCIDACNVLSTPPVGCPAGAGTCGYESSTRDICYTDATYFDAAALGATCTSTDALFCAVDGSVALGLCDSFERDDLGCRKACDADADCAGGETCAGIVGMKGLCVAKPANDTCQQADTAAVLTVGTAVTGNTGGAAGNYNAGLEASTCTNYAQAGGDVAYKIALEAGTAYTVTVSDVSPNFDPSVAIVGPGDASVCDAATLACLKGADTGLSGANETFTFTPTTAGNYYIIVDAYSATQGGGFKLTVTAP